MSIRATSTLDAGLLFKLPPKYTRIDTEYTFCSLTCFSPIYYIFLSRSVEVGNILGLLLVGILLPALPRFAEGGLTTSWLAGILMNTKKVTCGKNPIFRKLNTN